MKIDCMVLGDFQTNCYVVRENDSASDCLVVDVGLDPQDLLAFLRDHRLRPMAAVLTHGHIDHIAGLDELRRQYPGVKVYVHRLDAALLTDSEVNLSALAGADFATEQADVLLEDGDTIEEAGVSLAVLHTPGHTPGGICLYSKADGVLFCGDTLFADSVGRTDFPGGSMEQLLAGIHDKLLTLPDETTVYPGHGNRTTIARERRRNPFLRSHP